MCRVNSRGTRNTSVSRVKVAWVVEKTSSDPLKKQKRALFCLELSVSFEIQGLSLTYQVSWKNNLRILVKLFKRAVTSTWRILTMRWSNFLQKLQKKSINCKLPFLQKRVRIFFHSIYCLWYFYVYSSLYLSFLTLLEETS